MSYDYLILSCRKTVYRDNVTVGSNAIKRDQKNVDFIPRFLFPFFSNHFKILFTINIVSCNRNIFIALCNNNF